MLSKFVERHIDYQALGWAEKETGEERAKSIQKAFWRVGRECQITCVRAIHGGLIVIGL
jgi:hypothetical protein